MLETAPINLTFRAIGLLALTGVFFWVTALAHRMDPRVLHTKRLGLAGASLVAGLVWFAGTPSASQIGWHFLNTGQFRLCLPSTKNRLRHSLGSTRSDPCGRSHFFRR